MLFTNRKLTGKQDEKIEDLISCNTEIPNVIIANEKIQQWLQLYPEIVKAAKLQDLLQPLQFDESDLKILIEEFHKITPSNIDLKTYDFDKSYIGMDQKNNLNKLSQDYFDDVIKRHYSYFDSINIFLSFALIDSKFLFKVNISLPTISIKTMLVIF